MFDFAKEAGQALRNAIGGGKDDVSAQELAETLRAKGVTIENGRVSIQGDMVTINGVADSQAEKEKAILILGNTKGIARVNDQIQVKAGEGVQQVGQASRFYQVKSGDTLSKIAKDVYGDANQYPQIFEANRPMLKDPDEIYPGQVLRIPQH
ncbi:MAG TPA: peptidoglycan-binding protein LysM [Caulobacteraceae bacterium]|nr:peptidoglycan-binding protein LysM [Caulobacteraceae bacterium]